MKRVFALFIILLCVCFFSYAEWKIGTIVDDFGDPTGESFIYSLVEGTFSNSATSNSKAMIRVLAEVDVSPYPTVHWRFEIHDYNWDNPTESFYDDSSATIKIKEDNGSITTFINNNSKYFHDWNSLGLADGNTFTQMLKRNNVLKVNISIERYKYNFTIDCSDFKSVFEPYFNSIKPNLGKWFYQDNLESGRSLYDSLKSLYTGMGMTKYYPYGSYCYYNEVSANNQTYLYYFHIDNEDYSKNKYLSIDFSLDTVEKANGIATRTDVKSSNISSVSIIMNGKTTSLKFDNSSTYTWSAQESIQNIVDELLKGGKATLRLITKDKKTVDIPLDKEFAENHEKAKTISQY